MSQVLELTSASFEAEVLKSSEPVLVDFWAPWCGPCRMMAPTLDELSSELEEKVKIAKLNVEDSANQTLAAQYNIQSIPNMKLFKGGEVVGEFIGLRDKESLKTDLLAKI